VSLRYVLRRVIKQIVRVRPPVANSGSPETAPAGFVTKWPQGAEEQPTSSPVEVGLSQFEINEGGSIVRQSIGGRGYPAVTSASFEM